MSRRSLMYMGVFGDPVAHSLSPAMHNAALGALGLRYTYLKFHVPLANLKWALRGAAALGFKGVNLTIPLKVAALRLMTRVTAEARLVGAVNTVTIVGQHLEGHNTDGEGFLRSLRELRSLHEPRAAWHYDPRGSRVVVLGAGGAARAIVFALAGAGAREIAIVNRTLDHARWLALAVRRHTGVRVTSHQLARTIDWPRLFARTGLLVNTTSVGMHGESSLVPAAALSPPLRVVDLIYNPPETPLLRAARRRGLSAINGTGMLVHQGALAFERWTKRRAPVAVMHRALAHALKNR